jgi:hypothetical protein
MTLPFIIFRERQRCRIMPTDTLMLINSDWNAEYWDG